MQNDQLANPSQYCLKTSARVESDRRKVHPRSLLNEEPLGPSRIMQMDDNTFNNDSVQDDVQGTNKRRKSSSDANTRRKLLRISGLDAEGRDMPRSSSSSEDGDESKCSEDEDSGRRVDGHHYGANRMSMLAGEQSGDVANNCDNEELDDEEMETGNEIDKDYDVVDEDDVTNNVEERCVDGVEERNNGDDLNLDEDEDFDDKFEPEGRSGRTAVFGSEKGLNSEDDSNSLQERSDKPDVVDTELASVVAERRSSVSSTLTRFNQVALETKTGNNNNNVTVTNSSSESRRNKRKNFKPRNIVYQYEMCEDGDNELNDEYQLAVSNWEMSSQPKNSSRNSPAVGENSPTPVVQRTSPESLSEFCSKSSPRAAVDNDDYDQIRETGGDDDDNNEGPSGVSGGGDFDQPLDLSDSASAVEPVKQENNLIFHKHHNRKKNARRYPGPSEVKGPSRSSQSITGSPMDLTTASRPDDDKISTKLCSRPNNSDSCDVIDLSKGQVHISSAYNAVPNYATSLTTVPSSSGPISTATSTSVTVNSHSNNGNINSYSQNQSSNNGGAGFRINSSAGRASSSLPKCTPPSVTSTGISASLLDLVSAASPSKRNAKAAAAAAAAHAAAISLAQAVRDREDGHSEGGAAGMVGPAGLLSSLPPNMDASNMKEYAESTMKELLGLYGFNDMVESLTKNVPLPNMLSADVLGLLQSPASLFPSLLPRSVPSSSSSSKASTSVVTSVCHSPPLSHHGKLSHGGGGRMGQMNSTTTSPSPTNIAPSTSSHSQMKEDMYESLHSQVVGSMAKLANLPSGNIVGNPRTYLPPNMNTILRLAAMQKNKQTDVTSTSPSPTLPSANVPKSTVASSSRGRNSASGINSGIFQEQRKSAPIDYSRYVKRYVKMRLLRFSSSAECGNNSCKDLNYREHFHCLDCNSRVFIKKEEMIRHFKWHKKRDESLQHGFLRYSPMDDCSEKFPHCAHNRKQTHYHCLMYQDGCDKCYISTSDVQMHANYHRKDSAIIQEGFQRYRATEDCGLSICAFSGQRTTHFHCRRSGCNFTFKNKADMEKHKTYHIKDEQLNKDGFKKFMKHEGCSFESCRFSRVCNHIHCIRPGCTYVLHSSGQLYSHKRKHERRDNEMAYRKFKLAQSMMRSLGDNQGLPIGDEMKHGGDSLPPPVSSPGPSVCSPSSSSGLPSSALSSSASGFTAENAYNEVLHQSFSKYSAMLEAGGNLPLDSPVLPYGMVPGADPFSLIEFGADFLKGRSDDSWRKYLSRFTANDPCKTNCDLIYKDHYHCNAENCTMAFKSKDDVREHARNHELQDQITEAFYTTIDGGLPGSCPGDCPYQNKQRHYHCGWQSCREIILSVDKPFRRLDHYKMHEYTHKLNFSKEPVPLNITSCSSIDGIFRRKRGRPPKNRTVEFPVTSGSSEYPQAIYTSFKLPKLNHLPLQMSNDGCLTSPVGSMGAITPPVSKNSPSPGAQSILAGHLSPSITHPSKAFPKLSHLQPHIQKHLGPSASSTETTKGTAADDCSEDGFSDRQMDDDDDDPDADGHMNSRHNPDTSDDSDSSSNRFTTNYRHSSPSADSTPSSHNQSYGPFISNAVSANHMTNDLLHTFPNVADQLHINPLANFFNPSGAANVGPPQDLSCHNQSSGSLHPNGSSGSSHLEMNVGEQSSPVSTPPGAPSSLESYGSSPSSPHLQFVNQKHYPTSGANQMDAGGNLPTRGGGDEYIEGKKGKMTGLRLLRDEPVPEGYLRYRFNEDCRYTHCGYREHQTHFHCMRKDCGYSFCDKTRFVQHTARHERLDTLMGGDFQQFRAQVPCGRSECVYVTAPGNLANKASHFHCLKCEFVCTDTNKVVAHRRQHQKLDSITAAGFEKYTAQQSCNNDGCSHNQRQTHYHCVKCQYAVLGLSQMSAHKYRHLEG